jgi:hypothetical protein
MWDPRRLTTLSASMACYRDSFTFMFSFDGLRSVCKSMWHSWRWFLFNRSISSRQTIPVDKHSVFRLLTLAHSLGQQQVGGTRCCSLFLTASSMSDFHRHEKKFVEPTPSPNHTLPPKVQKLSDLHTMAHGKPEGLFALFPVLCGENAARMCSTSLSTFRACPGSSHNSQNLLLLNEGQFWIIMKAIMNLRVP